MTNTHRALRGFFQALIAVAYIAMVALIMSHAESLFGQKESILSFAIFLLLFVFSAAVMGITIFGKSVLLYLDGQKREGIQLLVHTVFYLGLLLVIGIFFLSL